jgi:hypothetical protein
VATPLKEHIRIPRRGFEYCSKQGRMATFFYFLCYLFNTRAQPWVVPSSKDFYMAPNRAHNF